MTAGHRTFSYEQALAMVPDVTSVTHSAVRNIEALVSRVQSLEEMERRRLEIEQAMGEIIDLWKARVDQLGGTARGLWSVGWKTGGGYYCWNYPEETISFLQPTEEGDDVEILPIN
jgi:hypothetical protein